jgi:hypothetical protein
MDLVKLIAIVMVPEDALLLVNATIVCIWLLLSQITSLMKFAQYVIQLAKLAEEAEATIVGNV